MKTFKITSFLLLVVYTGISIAQSGPQYRRSAVLNGNQVKTVFGNWGVIGQPTSGGPRGAWIYDNNGYVGDVSPLIGAEVNGQYLLNGVARDTTFHWVIDAPVARPALGGFDISNQGARQAFEPVSGYFNPNLAENRRPAMSSDPKSWPDSWPDKMGDMSDPGWPGSWNGLFGKLPNADLETFFVMDDNADNEYNIAAENDGQIFFRADPAQPNRNGLAMEVRVRALQWNDILAQDNIFWIYEITNQGATTYSNTAFGMLVGTFVGATGAGDDGSTEYDDDWSFFDVNEDLTYTGDFNEDNSRNPFWIGPVGFVGYAFLESPGNAFDGIDNDRDSENGAPFFEETDFMDLLITNSASPSFGQTNQVVTIDQNTYERTVVTFPPGQDTLIVVSQGVTYTLINGVTVLDEGSVENINGIEQVLANAYDGIDNDLDGLIDENYFLHYRQRRATAAGVILFDILNPLRRVNYITGAGVNSNMIDERRDDNIDNDNDWSRSPVTGELLYDINGVLLDDVGPDGLPGTGDSGENDGEPTAGEPNFDRTDKDESDQIGLSSFDYFVPAGEINLHIDDEMWEKLQPGFFDVPDTYQNGRPTAGEDGDFVYGSGFFPITPGQTERMSLALIFGETLDDLIKKLQTVRDIYNADYRFPIAPDKPVISAVAYDDSVVIYWDRGAEDSFDPVLRENDFEGYKIYRATDPNFNDAKDITNSKGNIIAYSPIAEFDLKNGIFGWYYPTNDIFQILQGWSYFLGNESGLQHQFTDYNVENGRTYFYAVVSYDRGVNASGVIPKECTKSIVEISPGVYQFDVNTISVVPGKPAAGYEGPKLFDDVEHLAGTGTGSVSYRVVDPTKLTGHEYEVYFWDTSNDGVDNDGDWTIDDDDDGDGKPTLGEDNFDYRDPNELEGITIAYAVKDLYEYQEDVSFDSTRFSFLTRKNLIEGSVVLQGGTGNVIDDSLYIVDYSKGKIRAAEDGVFNENFEYLLTYQYHPVYFSKNIHRPERNITESDIFDGITLEFENIWITENDLEGSGFNNDILHTFQWQFENATFPVVGLLKFVAFPSEYEIRFYSHIVDTSGDPLNISSVAPAFTPGPRKFEIYNVTGDYKIQYYHVDSRKDSTFSESERIYFMEKDPNGNFTIYTWLLRLASNSTYDYAFTDGDILSLQAEFPLNKFDLFRFQTELPRIDTQLAKSDLDNIRVVPNPYIASHDFEPPLPTGVTSGRGERIVFFTNVPDDAIIHIFTVRGEKVVTLENANANFGGTVKWNLKSSENLDIAYGVYFYVVKSKYGVKKGKLAIIK